MERASQRRTWLLFGILSLYIVLQFIWWAYLLISQENRLAVLAAQVQPDLAGAQGQRRVWMVVGEGSVLLLFLLVMLFVTFRSVQRELRLARSQRNFLLAVTHELRTPIASLKLQLQTLQRRGLSTDARQELEQRSITELDRLGALAEKVLQAVDPSSPLDNLKKEPCDLAVLTREIVGPTGRAQAAAHRTEMAVPEQLSCTTDPDAYRSILENLLENAVKYSPAGSTIRVELEQNGSVAELRVADQGVGIPAEERERIFERFYRGGDEEVRRTKGTGLGLYIVRRLVERMGGNVRVESRPGSGSIFAIRLPLQ